MIPSETSRKTETEYLAMDLESEGMLEYYEGRIVEKDRSSTFTHSKIGAALLGEIANSSEGGNCRAFYYKLRVATPVNCYMYPDVTIICGTAIMKNDCFDTITNPSVIIEIMTDATRDLDMGSKFWYSTQIPTLIEYFLVDSTQQQVIGARRQADDTWQFITAKGIDATITINAIGLELSLKNVYGDFVFSH